MMVSRLLLSAVLVGSCYPAWAWAQEEDGQREDGQRPSPEGSERGAQQQFDTSNQEEEEQGSDWLRRSAPPEVFRSGLSAFYGGDFDKASAQMYDYIATNDPGTENRAWAKYFLGVSLARLGYRQGASEYLFDVANDRTRPEVLPDALTEIEKLFARAYDEALLEKRLIVDSEFGYLPDEIAGFVRYRQGLSDLRAGRRPWAERLFAAIPRTSKYAARAAYTLGVALLSERKDARAVLQFRTALEHPKADRVTRNDARLALARVLYEKKQYAAADAMYRRVEVPELTAAEGEILLERAWTAFWQKDSRTAMGLLYALEAPSYATMVAPEKYLLRALIYQRACHYIPAKRAIRRFRLAFQPTLDHIRRRADLRDDRVLRTAARDANPELERQLEHRRQLAFERTRLEDAPGAWRETGLRDSLIQTYDLVSERVDRKLTAALQAASMTAAQDLVEFEEQMNLLDYEVGLSIYRRLQQERARRGEIESTDVPFTGPQAYYPFVEEFWNDELDRYDFLMTSRCFDEGDTG